MDIKELLNEYEALEINADDLKKEIEDAKAEKVKMADGHKKYWKEIKGKKLGESLNEELKYADKVEKLKEKGFSINRLSDSSIEISKEGKSGQEIYDELKEIGLEGNKINPSNVILENYTGIEIPADYKERLAKGTEYLEKYVATVDPEYYEIVEDNYEYPFGLLIIEYEDKEHEVEIGHTCINLYSPNYPNWDLDDEGHIIDESVNEAEKKYLTKEELLAKVKEGILPDEYVPSDIGQGMGYKINLRWEEVPTDDIVIYIPEYGYGMWDEPNNGMPKEDSIYTKADFREITKELGKRAEEEAEYLFQAVDWQYPESLWDEMEFDDEMDESIKPATRTLGKFKSIREDYDASTFQFCIRGGDIELLDRLIDEKIAEYDKADKAEKQEIAIAVDDMLRRLASSGENELPNAEFNRLYDKLAALDDRIIEDDRAAWKKAEEEVRASLKKEDKEEKPEKREVLPIKFIGVDEWNRPAFKPEGKKYYLTDVNNLFSEDATEEEVKKFYADAVEKGTALRDLITYHGYSLDDDPMGSKLKFDLEIV